LKIGDSQYFPPKEQEHFPPQSKSLTVLINTVRDFLFSVAGSCLDGITKRFFSCEKHYLQEKKIF
jgi:hypothetical protein